MLGPLVLALLMGPRGELGSQELPELVSQDDPVLLSSTLLFPPDDPPTPRCHASTLAETEDGLVAAWFGGTREGHEDVGIWVARHDGQTWLAAQRVASGGEDEEQEHPCWNPVLFQPANGPLLLYYKVGPSPSTWWGMCMQSNDGGKTWTDRRRLGSDPSIGALLGPVRGKPLQLDDGTILCPSSTEHEGWRVHLERTKDLGRTWSVIGPLHDGAIFAAIQPTLLRHADGRLQMLCRTRQKVLAQAWSSDDGASWSALTATSLPNPNAAVDAVTLADGRHLLVYNHTLPGAEFPSGRNQLNVALSNDGETWTPALTLERDRGEFSYPAVIQARDGKVHLTYTYWRLAVKHVVLDPEAL